ncbi:hypothetical protein Ait01nite_020330 [Actinoplanes italicus]|uniref:Uncharacterized protein n=1 Tax=Actinoplanes italicus TaxID=113567 RepID=A0A2T0KPA8_9ACTN|nr:hypothetical protein [Actinoplanes italicus]PRX25568.1 hypothetical protein CLV67_101285 [Actinoplanes italicus]GIE28988.1 hypothetical protein Ait01nite_020330 [Actinoplanes italicus]
MRGVVRPPYWVGQRLLTLAVHRWSEFHGTYLMRTGREPLHLPLPSLLDVIYAWWVEGGDEKDVAKFQQALAAPPASADLEDRPEWSDDETDRSFAAAMAVRPA